MSELQVPKIASHGRVEGETSLLSGHLRGGVGLTCCVTDAADNIAHGCCYCEMLTKVPNFWNRRKKKEEEEVGREGLLFLTETSLSVSLIPCGYHRSCGTSKSGPSEILTTILSLPKRKG